MSSTEVDPLLKDLNEKKQSFRRNVASLAAELKEARRRLASQEKLVVRETLTRQEAETKLKNMEREMCLLEKNLDEREMQIQASSSAAEMHAKEIEDLRLELSLTRATADASALSAQSSQLQCSALVKELEDKNFSLKEHEIRVNKLGQRLDLLQKDLLAREVSQVELKGEVSRIELDIMQALTKAGTNENCELRRILEELSPKIFENIKKLLNVKDQEIAELREEIRFMSAHWKLKTKELESQLEKHSRADQELKKKVLKLEFCLQEARAQTRKLQRMGERRDKAMKELRDQLAARGQSTPIESSNGKHSFWETPRFKIVVSMSMLVLVMFSKR